MPCFRPNYLTLESRRSGGRLEKIFHGAVPRCDDHRAFLSKKLGYQEVPCGKCMHCRLNYARVWGIRNMHESVMHHHSCFVTLTYAPEHVPWSGSLDRDAIPNFIAALRKKIGYNSIKYFGCGEYGDKKSRPHYHVLIYGWEPTQRVRVKRGLYPLYTSPQLEECWSWGYCPFGRVTFESANYVARYATKKLNGAFEDVYLYDTCPDTGELFYKQKEFLRVSNQGGIGRSWLEKYFDEVYPSDSVLVNGYLVNPPRFYDKILKERDPVMYEQVKAKRLRNIRDGKVLTFSQLDDYSRDLQSKFNNMMRSIE